MSGRRITPRDWQRFNQLRREGFSRAAAASECGISIASANRFELKSNQGEAVVPGMVVQDRHPEPIPLNLVNPEAKRALADFGYFQRRYFGRIATPWQQEAAEEVAAKIASPDKEYEVINAPPGSGKSTTFTLDIPAWLTARDRTIRGQIGSKVQTQARRYVMRLRRELERTLPWKAEDDDVERGLAQDAVATLSDDFGFFKPIESGEVWSADAFIVAQHGLVSIAEKEPTWSAYGMDSGFLGMRYDFVVWDDVVDNLTMRTVDGRENQRNWWDDIAEKRLEPSGFLLLQGQRLGPEDLYRYALDKRAPGFDENEDEDEELTRPKYHSIKFKAHYDEKCEGKHRKDSPAYPVGCLLDPRRLPWRELRTEQMKGGSKYEVIYQQEDVDPESVLVDKLWVSGGVDHKTGIEYPGCWDKERGIAELPMALTGDLLSFATADPSPTKYWSVQWWVVRCENGEAHERYLMDHIRDPMGANDFLDWKQTEGRFVGVMEDWRVRAERVGIPIGLWIVEANAAQRFMLQYDHMKRWLSQTGTDLIPHQTGSNKADPDLGIDTIASHWKYGRVRLPGKGTQAKFASLKLVDEVTKYPDGQTDDAVMAEWFGEWHLPRLIPGLGSIPRFKRPSWLQSASTYLYRRGASVG